MKDIAQRMTASSQPCTCSGLRVGPGLGALSMLALTYLSLERAQPIPPSSSLPPAPATEPIYVSEAQTQSLARQSDESLCTPFSLHISFDWKLTTALRAPSYLLGNYFWQGTGSVPEVEIIASQPRMASWTPANQLFSPITDAEVAYRDVRRLIPRRAASDPAPGSALLAPPTVLVLASGAPRSQGGPDQG